MFYLGVDLGQLADHTALALVEANQDVPYYATEYREAQRQHVLVEVTPATRYEVRNLLRVPLRTSYPEIVARVQTVMRQPDLVGKTTLVVDAGGVGRPVVDLLRKVGLQPIAVTLTAGHETTRPPHRPYDFNVPKADLVYYLNLMLMQDRLHLGARLPYADALLREMTSFEAVTNEATAHTAYNARVQEHDDLIIALCLGLWWHEYRQSKRAHVWGT